MPSCLVENMAPLTDTVCFIIACLILSEYKPIQISWQTQSLLSGALTLTKIGNLMHLIRGHVKVKEDPTMHHFGIPILLDLC